MNLKDTVQAYNVLDILGYLRKSRQDLEREKRTGEDTLSEQRQLMEKVLNGIELPYDIKMEIGSGESIDGRPVFQEVLKDLENGKYQAIAVKEISRLSRGNMGDAQKILDLLKELRLIIITPFKVYDVRNQMDFRQIRFELFLAREEYEMIKERMVGARYTYATQGKFVAGKAPYGYSYDKRTQKLKINEDEAKNVRMIYDMFLNGLNGSEVSYQAIATHMTRMGIETPRGRTTWSYSQIKSMLANDIYKGVIKFRTSERMKNGKRVARPQSEHIIVEDAHDEIIDKETWDKVQLKIKNKLPKPHNPLDFAPCELASVCVCSVCGGKLIRNCGTRIYKKQDGTESVYVKEFLKCQKNYCMSVKYRDVEEAILDALNQIKELDDKQLKQFVSYTIETVNKSKNEKSKSQMLEQIEYKEKELANRLEFIFDKYEKGIYTDEVFLQRKSVIEKEREELKAAKASLSGLNEDQEVRPLNKIRTDIDKTLNLYRTIKEKERKNKILLTTFDSVEVEILERGKGRKSAKFKITPLLRYDLLVETL